MVGIVSNGMLSLTRGERNHNPGNLQPAGWDGETGLEPATSEVPEPRFSVFSSDFYGLRALGKQLVAYQEKHGDQTIEQMINRYAPSSENATSSYIYFAETLCRAVTITIPCWAPSKQPYYLRQNNNLLFLMLAIIFMENGRCIYSFGDIHRAWAMS